MHKDDIESIAREISTHLKRDFYIEAEQHYNDHKWLCEYKGFIEGVRKEFFKWGTGMVAVGAVSLLAYGVYVVGITSH